MRSVGLLFQRGKGKKRGKKGEQRFKSKAADTTGTGGLFLLPKTDGNQGLFKAVQRNLIAKTKSYVRFHRPATKNQPGWSVSLGEKASAQLLAYQKAAEHSEIGGLVSLREIPDLSSETLEIRVEELIPLTTGAGGLALSSKAFGRGLMKAIEKNLDPDLIRGVWHTHPGMAIFWSGTDEGGIASLLKTNSLSGKKSWLLSVLASGVLVTGRIDRLIEGQQFQTPLPVSWAEDSEYTQKLIVEGQEILAAETPRSPFRTQKGSLTEEWGPEWEWQEWEERGSERNGVMEPLGVLPRGKDISLLPRFSPTDQEFTGVYCFKRDRYFSTEEWNSENAECNGCVHVEFCLSELIDDHALPRNDGIQDPDCPHFAREGQIPHCGFYGIRVTVEDCDFCTRY